MPKAAVNEDSETNLGENEIRVAEHGPVTPPARYAVRAKQSNKLQFGILVPARANARHHMRTLLFGKDISHGYSNPALWVRHPLPIEHILHGHIRQLPEDPQPLRAMRFSP